MAVTYVVGGLNIIAINEIAPDMLNKLAEAMRLARKAVQDAVESGRRAAGRWRHNARSSA